MLGRLIQTAASYGRGNTALESATEESHTRNLLYGQTIPAYQLPQSPPTSPYATQPFRPGTFDDRGALELEEKDVRILIAQDAFGAEEKPTLLFDSSSFAGNAQHPVSHVRHASMAGPRSPIPGDWKSAAPAPAGTLVDASIRNRSNTMSNSNTSWSRQIRDTATREEAVLECMFGVTNSTKTVSTTKMHWLPGKPKTTVKTEGRNRNTVDLSEANPRRVPLNRSRTSNAIVKSNHPTSLGLDTENQSQDAILITRLFSVALSETVAPTSPIIDVSDDQAAAQPSTSTQTLQGKKPKLVERKVPAFAIGLVVSLPRISEGRPVSMQTRPASRSTHTHTLSSASSSYGSDMQSSWTFLNAIPESLASSTSSNEESDRRIETIVANEDVLLRAIALLETEATRVIHRQLQKVLSSVVGPTPKTPKEKAMQRINQRVISINDVDAVSRAKPLRDTAKLVARRVIYALRIPRVLCGLGFGGGHWTDEARTVYRICGRRQQNFFLFTLLTAFLGSHTQWLPRLAPDWYQRQHRARVKNHKESHLLSHRTVIISDQRTTARRLIFLLASFLPGLQGLDGLQKPGDDFPVLAPFSASSPSSNLVRNESLRRTANRRMRESRLQSISHDRNPLSTSADSTDSATTAERPRRVVARKDSDALSIRGTSLLSMPDGESQLRKPSAGVTSALASQPATPVPVFSTKRNTDQEGYFPPFADVHQSVATAGLANILRRNSSSFGNSSNVSSRWGSLVSGLSDLWSNKQYPSGEYESATTYSSAVGSAERRSTEIMHGQRRSTNLQDMVDELDGERAILRKPTGTVPQSTRTSTSPDVFSSPTKQYASMPRLKVDDKDGVIDVELDFPGFPRLSIDEIFKSPPKSVNRSPVIPQLEVADSVRSIKSASGLSAGPRSSVETNVAGYLKHHHEDFSLYAVRPYPELEEDIKRTMLAEPRTVPTQIESSTALDVKWSAVCSTVIADMRTFSVRRITLRRRPERSRDPDARQDSASAVAPTVARPDLIEMQETFIEEEVKDFDTVLADAIERVLDINDVTQTSHGSTPRHGHSRAASSGTVNLTPPNRSAAGSVNFKAVPPDYTKQDCRQAVLGALEEIVKEICNDLGKLEMGRDICGDRSLDGAGVKKEMKQENVLREGVKCWLLDLEQPRVC